MSWIPENMAVNAQAITLTVAGGFDFTGEIVRFIRPSGDSYFFSFCFTKRAIIWLPDADCHGIRASPVSALLSLGRH